jgi:hypothetical protein
MGHDITLKTKKVQIENCFPTVGEGTYKADVVNGQLVPKTLQDNLYITHNLADIIYLALENIKEPKESFGEYLDGAKAKDVLPTLEKLFDEILTHPEIYEPLQPKPDPETGKAWGSYKGLCDKLYALIFACRKYPTAIIADWY